MNEYLSMIRRRHWLLKFLSNEFILMSVLDREQYFMGCLMIVRLCEENLYKRLN